MLRRGTTGSRRHLVIAGAAFCISAAACGADKPASSSGGAGGSAGLPGAGGAGGLDGQRAQKLVILHTNDIHSHLMGNSPEVDYSPASLNDDATLGGMARLATAIGTARTAAASDGTPVLLLDAGDFMMGTAFEFLAAAQAPELKFMHALGYDATTIGNHELDWTPVALAKILQVASAANATIPILASNMNFSATSPGDDELKMFAEAGVIRTKLVKQVGKVKVGFFGLLGADALRVTPQASPLTFDTIASAATRMVAELRGSDKVDLVVALSHSGIDSAGKGEDADLAMGVPGIDIIISGHTHDRLTTPVTVGKTLIVTAGSYGHYLGNMHVSVTPDTTAGGVPQVVLDSYVLQAVDDTIPGDGQTQTQVEELIAGVDTALAPAHVMYRKVVARTDSDLVLPSYTEATIGDLVTDAYRTVGAALQPTDPPVIAVEGNGQLRSPILKGKTGQIWFADLFRVIPLGIGPGANPVPGFPLVTFYLNAKDIRSGLELGAAREVVADQYFLQVSGVKVEYDMSKPAFGRVSSLKLVTTTGDQVLDVTNTTICYKVIATNYVAGLLGVVNSFTGGALSVTAKDADCSTAIDPTVRFVDADAAAPEVQELKHWQALLQYVSGFPADASGIPTIPVVYASPQGRITHK